MAGGGAGARLRQARQARGLSQQQLAGMAGVSRQAVSAVESGACDPSLRVAIALGRALGMTVEEIWDPAEPAPVGVRAAAPLGPPGARVSLAPLGDGFVAFPLRGASATRSGFLPAGAVVCAAPPGAQSQQVRPIGPPRPTLILAGCDPALPLLATPLSLLDPPVELAWWPCSSQEALRLAAAGLVHAAGAHLRGHSGEYNTAAASALLHDRAEVVGFCAWREGLVIRHELAERISGVADLPGSGSRLVNREPGAEARRVLDRELRRLGIEPAGLAGYDTRAAGHLEVAAAVAAGLADAGVASEPAALAYGLSFIPLAAERFDLVIPARQAAAREVQALGRVLSSRWLLDQLASLPGYDPGRCGQRVATI
jgi:putative molybdopterin biosynthesis protein